MLKNIECIDFLKIKIAQNKYKKTFAENQSIIINKYTDISNS